MSRTPSPKTELNPQEIQNLSFDKDFDVLAVELLGYDASTSNLVRLKTDSNGVVAANLSIPQVDSDPASPSQEDVWVLKSGGGITDTGTPIGLLLALTYAGTPTTVSYQLKYRTHENTNVAVTLA